MDYEFAELLWENGQVVLNSQIHQNQVRNSHHPLNCSATFGCSSILIQEDVSASRIPHALDAFMMHNPPSSSPTLLNRFSRSFNGGGNDFHNENSRIQDSGNGQSLRKAFGGNPMEDGNQMCLPNERVEIETPEMNFASPSGGSPEKDRTATIKARNQSHKRKDRDRDAEESESQSGEAGYVTVDENNPAQRSALARRSRAADVHNLSERRRRDRINEKLKALQELLPNCNKCDKASMLEEVIEYMKSLQLQLQMMWMAGGMTQVMCPSDRYHIPGVEMGMGMGNAVLSSFHGTMDSARAPPIWPFISPVHPNQAPICQSQGVNQLKSQPQMQTQFTNGSEMEKNGQKTTPANSIVQNNTQNDNLGWGTCSEF